MTDPTTDPKLEVLGPDDKLVMVMPLGFDADQAQHLSEQMAEFVGPGRGAVIVGADVYIVRADDEVTL